MGIVGAGIATFGLDIAFGVKLLPGLAGSHEFSTIMFFALGLWIYLFATKVDKTKV